MNKKFRTKQGSSGRPWRTARIGNAESNYPTPGIDAPSQSPRRFQRDRGDSDHESNEIALGQDADELLVLDDEQTADHMFDDEPAGL
jgi:hypothetical protein